MPARSRAWGGGDLSWKRRAEGAATLVQPPSAGVAVWDFSQGGTMLALRPACASWMAGTLPCSLGKAVMREGMGRWSAGGEGGGGGGGWRVWGGARGVFRSSPPPPPL